MCGLPTLLQAWRIGTSSEVMMLRDELTKRPGFLSPDWTVSLSQSAIRSRAQYRKSAESWVSVTRWRSGLVWPQSLYSAPRYNADS